MTTQQVEMESCPVCSLEVGLAMVTTEGTKLTTQNMTQARTCLYPTMIDGEAGSYIIYHASLDETQAAPGGDSESRGEQQAADLEGDLEYVWDRAIEATEGGTSTKRAEMAGLCSDVIPPNELPEHLDELVNRGLLAEIDDAVYKRDD